MRRQDPRSTVGQLGVLLRECRVELVSLGLAILLTALLANSLFVPVREWDSTSVVMLIGGLWMALCTAMYRFLLRTPR